jgi:carbon-monoxide dehydrogenase large subunit
MGAKWFGAAVKRKEDPALLAGKGRFIDDVRLPGTLHAALVRSASCSLQNRYRLYVGAT